jgi:hypothetical protein
VAGVLRMTLHNDGYSWAFVGTNDTVQDHGRHGCHA